MQLYVYCIFCIIQLNSVMHFNLVQSDDSIQFDHSIQFSNLDQRTARGTARVARRASARRIANSIALLSSIGTPH